MTADIRSDIDRSYGKAFVACADLAALEQKLRAEHPIRNIGGGMLVAVILQAKARKTFHAILVLAREGYGEDALVPSRSLTNLCIDLAYIAAGDTPIKVRAWLAYARVLPTPRSLCRRLPTGRFPGSSCAPWQPHRLRFGRRAGRTRQPGSME